MSFCSWTSWAEPRPARERLSQSRVSPLPRTPGSKSVRGRPLAVSPAFGPVLRRAVEDHGDAALGDQDLAVDGGHSALGLVEADALDADKLAGGVVDEVHAGHAGG